MAIAGVVAGLSLLGIGWARAGAIVRLAPLQVTAGFVGTTGSILLSGGVKVAAGRPLNLSALFDPSVAPRLAAMALIAAAFGLVTRKRTSPFVVPALIGASVLLHHAFCAVFGLSLAEQREAGWLIAFPSTLTLASPWAPATFAHIDWTALRHQLPALLVLALVAPISLLLTASGMETATRQEGDINQELRVGGLSSLLSGVAGGTIGFIAFARSLMLVKAGGRTRLAPILAALLIGLGPLAVPQALGLIPVTVLGALLAFLGGGLLHRWLYSTKNEMSLGEWLTIPVVIALSMTFGVIQGVFTGLILGCIHFVWSYAVRPPIRACYFGDVAISNVQRSSADRKVLQDTAQERLVIYLQGFLFFGTANSILRQVKARLAEAPGLRSLILDFREVDGADSSALTSFRRIVELASRHQIDVRFAATPQKLAERFDQAAFDRAAEFRMVSSLDEALEHCEERSLAAAGTEAGAPRTLLEAFTADLQDAETARMFLARFPLINYPAGATLMAQGEASDQLAFIESGRATVLVSFEGKAPVRVRTLVAGTMIGELGFYIGSPRSATIRAETDCRVLRIAKDALRLLEQEEPQAALIFHKLIARRLCRRIRDKDHLIEGLVRGMKQSTM